MPYFGFGVLGSASSDSSLGSSDGFQIPGRHPCARTSGRARQRTSAAPAAKRVCGESVPGTHSARIRPSSCRVPRIARISYGCRRYQHRVPRTAAPGRTIRNVSTGHRVVGRYQHTLLQYWTWQPDIVPPCATSVPDTA
eukprot:2617174-Rhodomonas_salina.1